MFHFIPLSPNEVLEEIEALPVGEIISDEAALSIAALWPDLLVREIIQKFMDPYVSGSDYEKLMIDHLSDWFYSEGLR